MVIVIAVVIMVKNTPIKKSVSKKTLKGKSSTEKGKKFEDEVADIFRLLGAKVIQNIEICNKKVDILATFQLPGSPTIHRVIVECKDEKRAINQNQRVMQFKGLLGSARELGDAESAEIITRVPWGDAAKGFALQSGITLLTYTEKIAQLIDFNTYLKNSVDRFEKGNSSRQGEPPLGAYYVDLSAERITKKETEQIPVIDDYINKWIQHDNAQHLAILGEYGTGKSSWCQKLAHDLAASYLQKTGSTRIPILFNLREFTKTLKIESIVSSFLDEECGVLNPRFKLFKAMNDAGIFLLIFDGFDEMAVKVDADTLEINLQEIEKLASSPKSKVIITSRLEYFISGAEENKSLCPKGELLATRQTEYEPLKIVQWGDEQVNSFLKKRVPLIKEAKKSWEYYRDRIRDIAGLSDLSRRPVLLDMIVKTLPKLIESGKPINRPNLYETYLLGEIKRQKILKRRTLLLTEEARFSLLQQLALDFYVNEITAITFTDGQKYVEEIIKPPKDELEAYTRDFMTCSFLVRKDDEYLFSHRSIMEYLIAKGLLEEIEQNAPNVFNRQQLEPVVAGFLSELNPNKDRLWNWIESTKSEAIEDIKYIGGNAATLLCMLDRNALAGRDLSKTFLFGASLISADLRGVNFSGTIMRNVDITMADFSINDLKLANIQNLKMTIFYYGIDIVKEEGVFGDEIFHQLHEKLNGKFLHKGGNTSLSDGEPMSIIGELSFRINNINDFQLIQTKITTIPFMKKVFYHNKEYETFISKLSESLKSQIEYYKAHIIKYRVLPEKIFDLQVK